MNTQSLHSNNERLVNEEIAKEKFERAFAEVHSYSQVNSDQYVSKAGIKTVMQLLIGAGITTKVDFYDRFTNNLIIESERIADMFDVEVPELDTDED